MTVTVLTFAYRKAGVTMAQFIDHYENVHMKVLQEVGGSSFPTSHTRRYIYRDDGPAGEGERTNVTTPATLFMGKQEDVDYDAIVEVKFEDEDHFQTFFKAITTAPGEAKVLKDEAMFLNTRKRTVMLVSRTETTAK